MRIALELEIALIQFSALCNRLSAATFSMLGFPSPAVFTVATAECFQT